MNRILALSRLAPALSVLLFALSADASTLTLQPLGKPRSLRGPIFGVSTTAFYEHLLDDPVKIATLKGMSVGLDRFPGGSDANFYNWRTGLFDFKASSNSSSYVQFWVKAAANIARSKPDGVSFEQYEAFSRQIGAQTIFVPNLESSSVSEQVAWFKHLAAKGIVPQRIELGNEFWVAMGNDPTSLARWPDEPASLRIMKQYLDAVRPYLPTNAKVAVQAAAGAIDVRRGRFGQRLQQWDEDLRPEPWFDAVTVHLYPRLRDVMGDPNAGVTPPTPENAIPRLTAIMARVDDGVERILQDLERRLPGKEIWVTEWNTRGANTVTQRTEASEPVSPAMEMLSTTRMALVHLRHPAVTASLFFMYSFRQQDAHAMFVPDNHGGYAPVPAAAAFHWLSEAANAGGTFQRLIQGGARAVPGGGAKTESYFPVEGGLFVSAKRTTLLIENASAASLTFTPSSLGAERQPNLVETITLPDLHTLDRMPARIETQNPTAPITVPPFSVTRVVWETTA